MQDKILKTHSFLIDPNENGGESLVLTTKFIGNGDPVTDKDGVFVNQELTLNSFCNSATFTLCGTTFTPERLRQLANELETARNAIKVTKPKKKQKV